MPTAPEPAQVGAARYRPHGPFHAELTARVDAYFADSGRSPQDAPGLHLKTLALVAWLGTSYAYALTLATAGWQVAVAAVFIGLAMAGIGFNIQHDGAHRAYSRSRRVNALAAAAMDAIGASSYVWAWKHNIFHHSNPNCVGLDADINIQPLCRLAPAQARRPWQRFQHLYIWFLYSLLALKWLFDDFRDVINGAVGGRPFPRPRGWKLAQFVLGKAFFVGWTMVIPTLLYPVSHVAAAWLLGSVTLSLVMACVFQMAHVVERASFSAQEDSASQTWAEHQVSATADFGASNRLLTWYTGALNFQIEHHLFPHVCHVHLPALAPIVRATCEAHGVPYKAYPSAHAALASHARWLREMGRAEAPG